MKRRKKKNSTMYWILGIALILILLYGGNNGWFKSNLSVINSVGSPAGNSNIPLNPTNENPNFYVALSLTPQNICLGESTLGQISSNMPNAQCSIFYYTNQWYLYKSITLSSTGSYSEYPSINAVGKATFKAVCFKDGNYRVSNAVDLTITACSDNNQPNQQQCTDSDNGLFPNVAGVCESSITQTGIADTCASFTSVYERYCTESGTCATQTISCPQGWICSAGQCQQIPCTSIVLPTSQADCDVATGEAGTCIFQPATLTVPAHCYLGV